MIVHQGSRDTIAGGITMLNIAARHLASNYPGLLRRAAELVVAENRSGAGELFDLARQLDPPSSADEADPPAD